MLFGKRAKPPETAPLDPLADLVLARLKVGYLVDYDMKTWIITAYNTYDFDGEKVEEWELSHDRSVCYLERYEDDEEVYTLAHKLLPGMLGEEVRTRLYAQQEPPTELTYEDQRYFQVASLAGYCRENGTGTPQPMLAWEYSNAAETYYLTVEQWGEREITASISIIVEPYQFSNILPGSGAEA